MAEHICDICVHNDACQAWLRNCENLDDDFFSSADNCPYFKNNDDGYCGCIDPIEVDDNGMCTDMLIRIVLDEDGE